MTGRVERLTAVMKTKNNIEYAVAVVAVAEAALVQIKAWRAAAPLLVRELVLGNRVSIENLRRVDVPRSFNQGTLSFEMQFTSATVVNDLGVGQIQQEAPFISLAQTAITLGRFSGFYN